MVFVGADGRSQVVTPAAFAQTIAAAGAQVRLVVLNACFTAPMAQALAAHVDCVVGMTGAIHDDAARIFSIGFYGGLGEHASVAAAFAHGRRRSTWKGCPTSTSRSSWCAMGSMPSELVLAAAEPSVLVDVPCPYPGMRPFSGRRHRSASTVATVEIAELIGRLRAGEREIFVIGPSGSGKSSLVTAGVLPRLARGVSGLGPFVVRELRPGEQPAARLGEALEVPEGGAAGRVGPGGGVARASRGGDVAAGRGRPARGAVHAGRRRRARRVSRSAAGVAHRAPLRGGVHAASRLLRRADGERLCGPSGAASYRASR